jgi:hypothetical protein
MTPLAVYILEQAQKAHGERLSEQEFLADFDQRLLGTTKVQLPSIDKAVTEIRQGGQWPWPDPSQHPAMERKDQERNEVPARRLDVISATREVRAASEDLKHLFDRLVTGADCAIEQIERGETALDVAHSMHLADRREKLNAAATRVRKGRHEFQRTMFLLAMAEGSSLAEIGRTWRVSRQLVSRMTKEKG